MEYRFLGDEGSRPLFPTRPSPLVLETPHRMPQLRIQRKNSRRTRTVEVTGDEFHIGRSSSCGLIT